MTDMQNTSLNATYSHLHFNIYKQFDISIVDQ